jgi:hypothetical protein
MNIHKNARMTVHLPAARRRLLSAPAYAASTAPRAAAARPKSAAARACVASNLQGPHNLGRPSPNHRVRSSVRNPG